MAPLPTGFVLRQLIDYDTEEQQENSPGARSLQQFKKWTRLGWIPKEEAERCVTDKEKISCACRYAGALPPS